ncbi:MAG: gamma-glutamyltransferase [Gemmatimonadota bacterium]|nr:gamma-glutamyltransferase [Gemmatimonadota bacterium]MDH5760744.1 gamma-glutamyltransferase [Gemmatimonadota bacterium]
MKRLRLVLLASLVAVSAGTPLSAQRTQKPVLHARHWVAITGKPMAATAGSMMYQKGGNAVDAAAAMLAATATMWDVLSWGGETQALIYHPGEKRVIGLNALGVAPSGATPEYFRERGMDFPPESGVDAMVTPGTPGGLMTMLAEWGRLSLADVLAPAIQMAEGYPMEADVVRRIRASADEMKSWPYTARVFFPEGEAPEVGGIFVQDDLAATLRKLVEAEERALAAGKSREEAIYAAYERFYRGDIAEEYVRGAREQGSSVTMADLDQWRVHVEEPVMTTYRDIEVYKLTTWVQGPVLLQALNILENFDLPSMGYNSARYMHALYQAMSLAFADRDFYYGDPYFPPEEPVAGLLSKEYARDRAAEIDWTRNDPDVVPGDPYPFQGEVNPFRHLLEQWGEGARPVTEASGPAAMQEFEEDFYLGTTSIQAADEDGWVVSITPSGGWVPAVIAGNTGVGMSQRAQSFVLSEVDNPYNVVEPGKRPRATLTPSLALKDGKPFLSFAVQGGDSQDQNLLQFFLNVVEFGMNVQEAAEAANINSFQMRGSFGMHESSPGRILLQDATPPWVRSELQRMGYTLTFAERTSGPINAIFFDWEHGSFWGASSHHGDDYGVVWEE